MERDLPIPEVVGNACSLLGLDPLQVANEGKLIAIVAERDADSVLAAMRDHDDGKQSAVIGRCVDPTIPAWWWRRTALGGTRVVDLPIGEQLPRIC